MGRRTRMGSGERVMVHTRTHGKAQVIPALMFVVLCVLAGFGIGLLRQVTSDQWYPLTAALVAAVAVLLILLVSVRPFLRWVTTTYTVTNRRLITGRGIIHRTGHDLPLNRVSNVATARSLTDRLLGCGTLTLTTTAGEPLRMHDIPRVGSVHLLITELMATTELRTDPE